MLGVNKYFAVTLVVLYIAAILYRLIRFVVNKRKAGIKTGVKYFEGYPSPASSACMNYINYLYEVYASYVKRYRSIFSTFYVSYLALVIFLTDSKIKYPHFGRVFVNSRIISTKIKALFFASFIIAIWRVIADKQYMYVNIFFGFFGITYTLLPIFHFKWAYEEEQ